MSNRIQLGTFGQSFGTELLIAIRTEHYCYIIWER